MTRMAMLRAVMMGSDVIGDRDSLAGLRAYHAAKAAINSNRRVGNDRRLSGARAALKGYNLIITLQLDQSIRIVNPLNKAEAILPL